MEQAQFFIPTRSKRTLISSLQDDSWEEQAFAEDASGHLGGCIWPPRSYSCSFCRREFRSAQALGGHMNVHRRDRARLKQSPSTHDENSVNLENKTQNPIGSLGFQNPSSQFCTLIYNPKPNPNFHPRLSRVSSATNKQEDCCDTSVSPCLPIAQNQNQGSNRYNQLFDLETDQGEKNPRILELGFNSKKDYVKADLSVSLNLVIRRTPPTLSEGKEEVAVSCKRRRTTETSCSSPSLIKTSNSVQSEVLELNPSFIIEDIDLELRLGRNSKGAK